MNPELNAYAAFAGRLADAARVEIAAWLDAPGGIDDKGGAAFDPVTEADRAAERAMRALIEAEYPTHGIAGEELGVKPAAGVWSWSLDPVDGTRALICGLPSWTVLIALLHDGAPVLGVIDAPRLDERCLGTGEACWLVTGDGRLPLKSSPLKSSACGSLGEARLATTDPFLFSKTEAEAFARVRRAARVTRYGLDGYAYARLAAGWIDLVVESGLHPHDYHALIPVVRAAGGVIGDWEGGEDFARGRVVAAASRELFEATVGLLAA